MTAAPIIDPSQFLDEQLAQASPDLMRELLTMFVNTLLSAQADSVCGAEYGARSSERTNRRNGYRHRDLDTRVGTLDVAIPKLREGSFFPDWLLQRHRRAEAALEVRDSGHGDPSLWDAFAAGEATDNIDQVAGVVGRAFSGAEDGVVAGQFSLYTEPRGREPDPGERPVERADQVGDELGECVAAPGVHGFVPEDEIETIVRRQMVAEARAAALVELEERLLREHPADVDEALAARLLETDLAALGPP